VQTCRVRRRTAWSSREPGRAGVDRYAAGESRE
jgi:hypothetical protein